MTNPDTSREAVERLIALYSRQYGNPTGGERRETADTLIALLAERDALLSVLEGAEYNVDLEWLKKHGCEGGHALGSEVANRTNQICSKRDDLFLGLIEANQEICRWQRKAEAAEAERDALKAKLEVAREALQWVENHRQDAISRAKHITAVEDLSVLDLCARHGFGAVIDSAARQWAKANIGPGSSAAFFVGGCIGDTTFQKALATLNADTPKEDKDNDQ